MKAVCATCSKEFEYNETFYNARGLRYPKHCPECRGKEQTSTLLSVDAIVVGMPLGRARKTVRENVVTSHRYKLTGSGGKYVYIYDLTKSEYPHIVALRVMKRLNKTYLVFDYPIGMPKYELVAYGKSGDKKVWEYPDILEVKLL